ncbi:TRAP transporter small permease [Virgibacillus salinus]|uniref:TRAP-type C4-dicarboxylate transport system, small permease component n=1 Tax=Virgibacillus salinus TaxID=553311 RepID=A0A1H1ESB0_9BACI|nr:TRAP transporter small permease [Virgibacillus salinus]SDQ91490.1 TRAP-type C4-dicarboxylate transport system, small permease component [Virgibacillus salinus]
MKTLDTWIESVEKVISIILIATLALVIATSVFYRYFLNAPIYWATEASIFMMAWLTFVGGSLGLKYKSQASITFLVERLSMNGKRILDMFSHIVILVFLIILLYLSYDWIFSLSSQKSSAMRIPMWVPYLSVPVGLTFSFIHLLNYTIDLVKNNKQEGNAS